MIKFFERIVVGVLISGISLAFWCALDWSYDHLLPPDTYWHMMLFGCFVGYGAVVVTEKVK